MLELNLEIVYFTVKPRLSYCQHIFMIMMKIINIICFCSVVGLSSYLFWDNKKNTEDFKDKLEEERENFEKKLQQLETKNDELIKSMNEKMEVKDGCERMEEKQCRTSTDTSIDIVSSTDTSIDIDIETGLYWTVIGIGIGIVIIGTMNWNWSVEMPGEEKAIIEDNIPEDDTGEILVQRPQPRRARRYPCEQ